MADDVKPVAMKDIPKPKAAPKAADRAKGPPEDLSSIPDQLHKINRRRAFAGLRPITVAEAEAYMGGLKPGKQALAADGGVTRSAEVRDLSVLEGANVPVLKGA